MKKLFSLLLSIMLVLSALPFNTAAGESYDPISLNQEKNVYCSSAGTWNVFRFTPSESGIYIFSSSGSLDTLGYIALNPGEAENENIKDDGGQENNFAVTYTMTACTTYYLGSTVIAGNTGTYQVKIIKFEVDDDTIRPITPGRTTSVTSYKGEKVKFFSFVPETTGKYIYYASGSFDTRGYVFDEYWSQIAFAYEGGSGSNFQISIDLEADKTYYIGYTTTYSSTANFSIMIYLSSAIRDISVISLPNKTTYIKGIDTTYLGEYVYRVNLALLGFEFGVNYANGKTEVKRYIYGIRGLDCEPTQSLALGDNYVRFKYMDKKSSFKVTLIEPPVQSLTMLQPPDKMVYYKEDAETAVNEEKIFNILLRGMLLKVQYKDGTSKNITISSSYGEEIEYFYFDHVVKADSMVLGKNTFTLSYYGTQMSFDVTYSLNSDNWQYSIADDEVILTKYIGTDTRAVIPEELDGYPVTQIGDGCFEDKTALKEVKMSSIITSIGNRAFYNCSSLKELTIPASVTSVGSEAMLGLKKLENLNWNASVSAAFADGAHTFAYMGNETENGTTVEFGYDCERIPQNFFYSSIVNYSPSIGKVIVGENVQSIGNNAFRNVKGLKTVEWNATEITTSIGSANNIWNGAASVESPFEVFVGEYVHSLPNNLFYSSNAASAPRVSKYTVESKNTTVATNTFRANSSVPPVFYCRFNDDSDVNSVYKLCLEKEYDFVLLDSPLDHVYMRSMPEKSDFIIGEELDLTGLIIYAVFEDGSEEDITEKVVATGFDNTLLGDQTIELTYSFIDRTRSIELDVFVSEEPLVLDYLEITSPAQTLSYFEGDNFESAGLSVDAHFTNGVVQNVNDFIIISGFDMSVPGIQSVSVEYTYEGVTRSVSYEIEVRAIVLSELIISNAPQKTSYLVGEEFNPDGIVLTARYNNGDEADVTSLCDFSGYDLSAKGTQTVAAAYTEKGVTKTASFEISVSNDLQSITIDSPAQKTEFVVGSEFDSSGLAVTAHFENGTETDVTALVNLSGYNMAEAGSQTVLITYEDDGIIKSASYPINVLAVAVDRIEIVTEPSEKQYIKESFHAEGLRVNAYFNDGRIENVSYEITVADFDNTRVGFQTISLLYTFASKTVSAELNVYVFNKEATGIEISSKPDKTAYLLGESLDLEGLQVSLLYNNSTKDPLEAGSYIVSGVDTSVAGTKTVNVTYTEEGKTFSNFFYVSVLNYETALRVNAPAKTQYFYGEEFNPAGMSITLTMADGSEKTVYTGYERSEFDKSALGVQTISVSFTSEVTQNTLSDSFEVVVNNFETAISSVTPPSKQEYFYGESIDKAGLGAEVIMADGSRENRDSSDLSVSGYDPEKLGGQELAAALVNAKGERLEGSFNVSVKNYESEISVIPPSKQEYFYGDELELDGLGAAVTFADGSVGTLGADTLAVSGYDSHAIGSQNIGVEFTNAKGEVLSDSFEVVVNNYETAISVNPPLKTEYFYGEQFDKTGISAALTMADGSSSNAGEDKLSVSGYNAQILGAQTLQADFTGAKGDTLSDSFEVNVLNYESSLEIVSFGKTEYSYGDELDTSALSVRAVMADSTRKALQNSSLSVSGYDPIIVGDQELTVSFTNAKGDIITTVYTVNVKNTGTSIKVSAPTKTEYYYGEALDTAGMEVTLENIDGTSTPVDNSAVTVVGFIPTKLGEQSIIVSYITTDGQLLRDRFKVNVKNFESSLEIYKEAKTQFIYGDEFETGALVVRAVMADGAKNTLELSALGFSGYNPNKAGTQTITVSFVNAKGRTISVCYEVEVINYETSFTLMAPSKKQYFYGEELDLTGIRAIAQMADKKTTNVDVSRLYCTGYNPCVLGEQTVSVNLDTVKGTTLTKTYKVTVNNFEEFLSVSAPIKTEYFYGEELNLGGMKVTAVMADSSEKTLANSDCSAEGFNSELIGTQDITVSFVNAKGDTICDTFSVEIKNFETALSITPPAKTVYLYGEELESEGLSATLTMADGSETAPELSSLSFSGFASDSLGAQTVTVNYTNAKGESLSDSFGVEIKNYLLSLEIESEGQTQFLLGEEFNTDSLVLNAVYADGSKSVLSEGYTISGADTSVTGEQSVTVSFSQDGKEASATYKILVESQIMRADINSDGFVDIADISVVLSGENFAKNTELAADNRADADRSGNINIEDVYLLLRADHYGKRA